MYYFYLLYKIPHFVELSPPPPSTTDQDRSLAGRHLGVVDPLGQLKLSLALNPNPCKFITFILFIHSNLFFFKNRLTLISVL